MAPSPNLYQLHAPMLFLLTAAAAVAVAAVAVAATNPMVSLPGCVNTCGDITVPFPFGLTPACSRNDQYTLTCNNSSNPPKLRFFFSAFGDSEVTNISLNPAEASVSQEVSQFCIRQNESVDGIRTISSKSFSLAGPYGPFRYSTRNRFTAIGCATFAYFVDLQGYYSTGCVSLCRKESNITDGACTGVGCCQSLISPGNWFYESWFEDRFKSNLVADVNPCSYSFLVDTDKFSFKKSDLSRMDVFKTTIALDWAITSASISCEEAQRNATDYACRSQNSECYVATGSAPGYLCNCSKGYEGNPYLAGGCRDVDECKTPEQYSCYGDCVNRVGSFDCMCPKGQEGDPKIKGGCRSKDRFTTALKAIIGGSVGIVFIALLSLMLYLGSQRKKLLHAKRMFFEQNGGLLLQQQFGLHRGSAFKIYSKEELEKATHNFDPNRVLGRGGQGTVYKGVLEDKTVVAIKRAKQCGEGGGHAKEFAKEMMILSQINHRNVVKLLGCCLEVEVPMLVYQYVPNGTLFHFIHETYHQAPIPLARRLKIAVETAEALAYLHSSASPPILHGDVKSANVLLDDDFSAKVSDFGASRLAPTDESQLATLVQGTCGYLDPEFMLTSLLTDKSDVYSFAVVLLELLTRRKALYFEGPEEERSLALRFIIAMNENRLLDIFDGQVIGEGERDIIEDVAELVNRCLRMNREERPTMKEVAESLARLLKQYY